VARIVRVPRAPYKERASPAEHALQVIGRSAQPMVGFALDGMIVSWNAAAEALLVIPPDALAEAPPMPGKDRQPDVLDGTRPLDISQRHGFTAGALDGR
jgi:hypothetical protein